MSGREGRNRHLERVPVMEEIRKMEIENNGDGMADV